MKSKVSFKNHLFFILLKIIYNKKSHFLEVCVWCLFLNEQFSWMFLSYFILVHWNCTSDVFYVSLSTCGVTVFVLSKACVPGIVLSFLISWRQKNHKDMNVKINCDACNDFNEFLLLLLCISSKRNEFFKCFIGPVSRQQRSSPGRGSQIGM